MIQGENKKTYIILHNLAPASEPPDKNEITEIISSLKNNKASGEDNIVAEMLKLAPGSLIDKLEQLFKEIWKSEKIPSDWKNAVIHPLHKKGDRTDPNNYRGISLVSVVYKILSKALLNRIQPTVEKELGEYQAGFRPGRSCAEQIFNLKSILFNNTRGTKRDIVAIFVDFKKAYDSIHRVSF